MPLCGRADLVRMLAAGEREAFLANLAGYYVVAHAKEEDTRKESSAPQRMDIELGDEQFKPQVSRLDWAPLPFFFAASFEPFSDEDEREQPEQQVKAYSMAELAERASVREISTPETPALAAWPRLQRRVAGLLLQDSRSRQLDVDLLVRNLSRGRMPRTLPFRNRKRWPRRLNVIVDRSRRLTPFWQDQDKVMLRLSRWLGKNNVHEYRVYDGLIEPIPMGKARRHRRKITASELVLVLGDCGGLTGYKPLIYEWYHLAQTIETAGGSLAVLVPAPVSRWAGLLPGACKMALWERSATSEKAGSRDKLAERAERLLSLTSYAIRVEPGLLRTIRRLLPPGEADSATESDVWSHPDIASGSSVALTISPDALQELRDRFLREDAVLRGKIYRAIRQWHKLLPQEIWHEELLNLPEEDLIQFPEDDRRAALNDLRKIAQTLRSSEAQVDPNYAAAMYAWFKRFKARTHFNAGLWKNTPGLSRELQQTDALVHQTDIVVETAVGYDPRRDGDRGPERIWSVYQTGETFTITESAQNQLTTSSSTGSPIALLRSTRPVLHAFAEEEELVQEGYLVTVALDAATGRRFREYLTHPAWASAFGKDEYGVCATFEYGNVRQRLRYIEPDQFAMGSPEREIGRWGDEQQHQVILTRGFWLFDTPVTQALWQAVMGNNPSRFKSPDRPVETVSWEESRTFIEELNGRMPGLDLQLPTEAQWEYACRAGTMTATWAGDLEDTTKSNVLKEIAWYSPNSEGQTHPVAAKQANPWGLYDMLGNIHEWCADWWTEDLGSNMVVDPTGPEEGADRVLRGGSWSSDARVVRAAYRLHFDPGIRDGFLGFRCARVQESMSYRKPAGGDGGADAEPLEASAAARSSLSGTTGTKYIIQPDQPVSIAVSQGLRLQLQSDQGTLTLSSITRPDWADAAGRDRFGLWVAFRFGEVEQRMRWIPPGQFMMGSPATEAGRDTDETQHPVTLTRGFWLFDTPVTQALWQAVMGNNPSYFKSPDRPVERVSWEESRAFIDALNGRMPGLDLQLPTEAQWEYACRAGTATATYAGDLDLKGENNAPVLDDIAWYGGNSGVDFELSNGYDSSDWKEKQYDHSKAGTHPVAEKQANPWGLYDMLGNVYEWCADRWAEVLGNNMVVDPTGPEEGAFRVIRGGCWDFSARDVRAAFRYRDAPGDRYDYLGFRCARVQAGDGVRDGGGPVAERRGVSRKEGMQ